MEIVFTHCAGLDVHKKFLIACLLIRDAQGTMHKQVRRFSTMTQDLERLRAWLLAAECTHVVMESTGVYWQPVYNILEGHLEVWLVNAQHVKYVPGRKTDLKDAEWLAQLMQRGLLRPSFIPPRQQRELREVVRYRQQLIQERTRAANRLQKVLEDANLKLTCVASDVQGVSAQAILRTLLAGQEDPAQLAQLARGQLQKKQAALAQALDGRVRPHHRFMLAQLLSHLDFLDDQVWKLERQIEARLKQLPGFAKAVERLDTIPGVGRQTAILIVAEVGIDMTRFPSAKHLTAWAGLAPGQNETGGKQRAAATRKGNRYLRWGLTQAGQAAGRTKDTYLHALYHRLAARRGKPRATLAVGRTILEMAYYLLTRETTYTDLGADYFDRQDREHATQRMVHRLEALGYTVTLTEPPLGTAA
jgi:transposase